MGAGRPPASTPSGFDGGSANGPRDRFDAEQAVFAALLDEFWSALAQRTLDSNDDDRHTLDVVHHH